MNDTRKISKKGWGFLFVVLAIMYARSFKPKLWVEGILFSIVEFVLLL